MLEQLLVPGGAVALVPADPGRRSSARYSAPGTLGRRDPAGCPAQHAALVRPYATWHVLRRARRRSRGRGAFTMSAAGWARGRILVALAFLAWLDERGTTLGAATQADVDTWLDGATRYRYLLRDFLTWAGARRLAGEVTVPALPRSELTGLITEDSRWQLLSRCLRDPGIPLDVRTAGAFLLLYGQFVSRLTRLTAADIDQHGPDASPHGLWAPALQRMQHFERARDWKPCPRRLSLDPVTGEATA